MELDKLLTQVEKARRAPLQVCCRTPAGELITTTVEDCARQGCDTSTSWQMILMRCWTKS